MSEYWKSTPKYWCKFCSVYVKDTKFERQQHEATGRHQGSIQRSLRDLHRSQEVEARKVQQAKNEVARLNGIVGGSSSSSSSTTTTTTTTTSTAAAGGHRVGGARQPEKRATLDDRKRQWEQLAAMGVAVPEEARGGLAMVGEWRVVERRVVGEVGGDGEVRALNKGVRKRVVEEGEEEEIAAGRTIARRKGWGHTFKALPGRGGEEEDLDALLRGVRVDRVEVGAEGVKKEVSEEWEVSEDVKEEVKEEVKDEEVPAALLDIPTEEEAAEKYVGIPVKQEQVEPAVPKVVFKKRRKIAK